MPRQLSTHVVPGPVAGSGAGSGAVGVRRCGCGVPLSRYNPDQACATCRAAGVPQPGPLPALPAFEVVLPDVGALIRSWRIEHQVSQATLAGLLGYDQSFLSMVERGRRRVRDIEALARIAARLGFTPEQLGVAATVLRTPTPAGATP